MTGADVVAEARTMLGTRWVHQGRMPGVALDCAGLVICTARNLGLVPANWDVNGYSMAPDGTMLEWCSHMMQPLEREELGCVVVVQPDDQPQHMGIVCDYRHGGWGLIHASMAARKAVETRLMFAKNFKLCGLFRMPGVQHG